MMTSFITCLYIPLSAGFLPYSVCGMCRFLFVLVFRAARVLKSSSQMCGRVSPNYGKRGNCLRVPLLGTAETRMCVAFEVVGSSPG